MISCTDLERICSALSRAFAKLSDSFGGKSVILAGDFAQLPPPGRGGPLYSPSVGSWGKSTTGTGQRAALGKSLWHSFTTVVILRENMRQRGLSSEDAAFRTALAHMRYGRCTSEDIALLRSRIYDGTANSAIQCIDGFESVSVITALNSHRDAINYDHARRFASDSSHQLHTFYSVDSWGSTRGDSSTRRMQRAFEAVIDPLRRSNRLPEQVQNQVWNVRPALTKHLAGMLHLCEGMPVVLKQNEATELGATNGAAATVVGWNSHTDEGGREYLDVLFVQLVCPPSGDVQLSGLPINVIPIAQTKRGVQCHLPFDKRPIAIQREQVPCLPNFSVTDYGCQGQTRGKNVVHPRHCANQQSIYTALSRSTSLADTIILGDFDASKLQRGTAPALMQEF
ncbi:hypothetical protein C8Q79DRAFT_887162, partial [Trametes meyenii]